MTMYHAPPPRWMRWGALLPPRQTVDFRIWLVVRALLVTLVGALTGSTVDPPYSPWITGIATAVISGFVVILIPWVFERFMPEDL